MTALLRLEGVQVAAAGQRPRKRLLDVGELHVVPGETLAVLGPTGAGKSTLLRVMNGLVKPDRGRLEWEGQPVAIPMPLGVRRRMAMAMQDPLLFRGSVADNVAYGMKVRGVRGPELRQRAAKALEMFSVGHLADRASTRLSGGEAHRVSLARAVVLRPDLLLLDEPLASVDAVMRDRLGEELRQVIRAEGMTCVYVTHDQAEAQRMADRIVVLEEGRVLQAGTPEEIFYHPATERVAWFVKTGNVLKGTIRSVHDGSAQIEVGERILEAVSNLPVGTRVIVCLRPEEIVLVKGGEQRAAGERIDSARNRLRCTVAAVEVQGPIANVTLDGGLRLLVLITRRSVEDMGLRAGDVVEATFKATALHIVEQTEVASNAASA